MEVLPVGGAFILVLFAGGFVKNRTLYYYGLVAWLVACLLTGSDYSSSDVVVALTTYPFVWLLGSAAGMIQKAVQ